MCATAAGYLHTVYVDGVGHPRPQPRRRAALHGGELEHRTDRLVRRRQRHAAAGRHRHGRSATRVISADARFAGTVVRNVEVTVHDNLTPGVVLTQLDASGQPDTEHHGHQGHADDAAHRHLHGAAAEPTDRHRHLRHHPVGRPDHPVQRRCAVQPGGRRGRGADLPDHGSPPDRLGTPVLITVTAVDNFARAGPALHDAVRDASTRTSSAVTPRYDGVTARSTCSSWTTTARGLRRPERRLDAGQRQRVARHRHLHDPAAVRARRGTTVTVGIITDGQTSVATDPTCGDACSAGLPRAGRAPRGQGRSSPATSPSPARRSPGRPARSSAASSTHGFAAGQRLLRAPVPAASSNTTATAYTITAVTASTITLTAALPAGGTFSGVTLSRVVPGRPVHRRGHLNAATHVLTRTDGGSWLDSGFLEGQLVQLAGVAGTFKIQSIFGADAEQHDVHDGAARWPPAPSRMTQYAPVVTFDATNWWMPGHRHRLGRRRLRPPGRPSGPHRLPQAGRTCSRPSAARSRSTAAPPGCTASLVVRGHRARPRSTPRRSASAPSPPRPARSTCSTSSTTAAARTWSATLTSTALTGFGMGPDLTFAGATAFGEPVRFPGGISYGSITLDAAGQLHQRRLDDDHRGPQHPARPGQRHADRSRSTMVPGADTAEDDKLADRHPVAARRRHDRCRAAATRCSPSPAPSPSPVPGASPAPTASPGRPPGSPSGSPGQPAGLRRRRLHVTGFADGGTTLLLSGPGPRGRGHGHGHGVGLRRDLAADRVRPCRWRPHHRHRRRWSRPRRSSSSVTPRRTASGTRGRRPHSPGTSSVRSRRSNRSATRRTSSSRSPRPFQYVGQRRHRRQRRLRRARLHHARLPADHRGSRPTAAPGHDTIIGSQTGDLIAGGSGDDIVLGQRGRDLIYGDSGINVDVITRVAHRRHRQRQRARRPPTPCSPATTCSSARASARRPAGWPATPTTRTSSSVTTAPSPRTCRTCAPGRSTRPRTPSCPATACGCSGSRPPLELMHLQTVQPQNGVSDTIDGDLGNDLLLGGGGSDTIWGNDGNDLVFGDFGQVDARAEPHHRRHGDRLRIEASLLPFNVALNNHLFTWTSIVHAVRPRTGATTSSPVTPATTSSSAAPAPTGSPVAPGTTTSSAATPGPRSPGWRQLRWGRRLQRRRRASRRAPSATATSTTARAALTAHTAHASARWCLHLRRLPRRRHRQRRHRR